MTIRELDFRLTMQVDNNLETVISSPSDCLPKVIDLSIDKWFSTGGVEGPISDWHTDMVEANERKQGNWS
jgi:hypothetical protein